jgi:5-formyltetrahydrofolate cyclo-ligase
MKLAKEKLREEALRRREALSKSQVLQWSRAIQDRVLSFSAYQRSLSVALYSAIGNEVATDGIHRHALGAGKRLFYPKLQAEHDSLLVQVEEGEEMRAGRFGVLEPAGDRALNESEYQGLVVFAPVVCFDREGHRLGRGGGWYDRLLGRLGGAVPVIGLAYESQCVDAVPTDSWDRSVDYVATEQRMIDCAAPSRRRDLFL